MAATKKEITKWVKNGLEINATHVIIALDTWDYTNYPIYVLFGDNVNSKVNSIMNGSDRIDEVYNLSLDIEQQLNSIRSWNF